MDDFAPHLLLTSTQAASLLEVHPSTIKRWCNEGDLAFDTTSGGHRRIRLADAVSFARAKDITTVLTPFHPYEGHVWTALSEAEAEGSFQRLLSLAMGWVHRGRLRRVARLFDALAATPSVPLLRFCDEAVRGLMTEVGRAWHEGRLRAGEEHMVSQVMTEVLLRLRERDQRARDPDASRAGLALVGSAEGNQHHLGSMAVRILLERRGWEVLYLGPDVPLEDFAMIQRRRAADLVCVSLAPPAAIGDVARVVGVLGEFYDHARPYRLALGGAVPDMTGSTLLDRLPFEGVGLFEDCAGFDARLEAGWASRRAVGVGA